MTAKDNYSFEPLDPSAPVVEAVPSNAPESYYEESELPSDNAILIGCGLLGWVVA